MALTKTFRRSGVLLLAGVTLLLAATAGLPGGVWETAGVVLLLLAGPVFTVSAVRHLLRGLLGNVGSRIKRFFWFPGQYTLLYSRYAF